MQTASRRIGRLLDVSCCKPATFVPYPMTRRPTGSRASFRKVHPGLCDQGVIPTSVIQGNPLCFFFFFGGGGGRGGLVFERPFWLYHRFVDSISTAALEFILLDSWTRARRARHVWFWSLMVNAVMESLYMMLSGIAKDSGDIRGIGTLLSSRVARRLVGNRTPRRQIYWT